MDKIGPILNASLAHFSMTEIATIFAGYAESAVASPRLFRSIWKNISHRIPEIPPKTAVSLIYSSCRIRKKDAFADPQTQQSVLDIAFSGVSSLSAVDCLHLLTACNTLGTFPRDPIIAVMDKIKPQIERLGDDQAFTTLCTIVKSG